MHTGGLLLGEAMSPEGLILGLIMLAAGSAASLLGWSLIRIMKGIDLSQARVESKVEVMTEKVSAATTSNSVQDVVIDGIKTRLDTVEAEVTVLRTQMSLWEQWKTSISGFLSRVGLDKGRGK